MLHRHILPAVLFWLALPVGAQSTCDCWVEPDSTWTFLGNVGYQPVHPSIWGPYTYGGTGHYFGPLELPFGFDFCGEVMHAVFINQIGSISFGSPITNRAPVNLPVPTPAFVAPFWVVTTVQIPSTPSNPFAGRLNEVAYKLTPTALSVSWKNMGNAVNELDTVNSFQLTISNGTDPAIPEGNNIAFCYGDMRWGLSQGVPSNTGPRPSTVGANRGNGVDFVQLGRFVHPDSLWNGRFAASGFEWLNGRHLAFNTAAQNIPPFFSTTECDTVDVNVGGTGHYVIVAHRGDPAPPLTATSICPGIASYAYTDQQVEGARVLTATFTPDDGEVGLHAMYFQAATGSGLVSTTQRYVRVNGPLGMHGQAKANGVSVFPNPARNKAILTWADGLAPQQIQLLGMDGRVVQMLVAPPGSHQAELDLSRLPGGIYLVRMAGAQAVRAMRLVHEPGR